MSEGKHTPLPWHMDEPENERNTLTRIVSSDGIMLVHAHSYPKYSAKHPDAAVRRANAEFIVRAVNSHQMLVEALRKCAAVLAGDHMTKQALIDALEAASMALAYAAPPVESKSEVVG